MAKQRKLQRLKTIEQILRDRNVSSQVQLQTLLDHQNISVNQSTLSRDLNELGASLVRQENGILRYLLPNAESAIVSPDIELARTIGENVIDIQRSNDMLVLRTPPARASVLAYALDRARLQHVCGCIAGDDTVLVIAEAGRGQTVARKLQP